MSAERMDSNEESVDQYLFHPDKSKQKDFDTDVNPLHEEALQGFDCMDKDGDGYLLKSELEAREQCVDNAKERGLEASSRTPVILDLMDADRDSRVSKREFNIWNEMRFQQH
jgi:Ca2+-binding EF-hand superfamily protein